FLVFAISAFGQFGRPKSGLQPMRSAVDLIKKQAPLQVNQVLLAKISQGDVHVIVSLGNNVLTSWWARRSRLIPRFHRVKRATLRPAGTCTSWKKIRTISRLFTVTLLIAPAVLFARA